MKKIRVGIEGGAGFTGGELIRLLLSHPKVEISAATSSTFPGQPVFLAHPNQETQAIAPRHQVIGDDHLVGVLAHEELGVLGRSGRSNVKIQLECGFPHLKQRLVVVDNEHGI